MGGGGEKEAKTRKRPPRQKKGAKGDLENTKTHPQKNTSRERFLLGSGEKKVNRKKVFN